MLDRNRVKPRDRRGQPEEAEKREILPTESSAAPAKPKCNESQREDQEGRRDRRRVGPKDELGARQERNTVVISRQHCGAHEHESNYERPAAAGDALDRAAAAELKENKVAESNHATTLERFL